MDYILFGIGSGASLALIGWLLRELGPRLRDGRVVDGQILSARQLIDRMSWSRFCKTCGTAFALGGTVILLVTAAVAIWNPGDHLAMRIMFGTYAGISLLLITWAFLYAHQFGSTGIYRPVERKAPPPTTEASPVKAAAPSAPAPEPGVDDEPAATSDEPATAIEEVAARPGGLGRFAAFFQRDREEPPADDDMVIAEEATVVVETEDAPEPTVDGAPEPEDLSDEETDSGETETVDVMVEEDVTIDDAEDDEPGPSPEDTAPPPATGEPDGGSLPESDALTVVEAPDDDDRSDGDDPHPESEAGVSEPEPAPVVTPEDDALTVLRKRRLARLSDTDES